MRTKGSKNKPKTQDMGEFIQVIRNEVATVAIPTAQADKILIQEAKKLAGYTENQKFENEEVNYTKDGYNIVLTNPSVIPVEQNTK